MLLGMEKSKAKVLEDSRRASFTLISPDREGTGSLLGLFSATQWHNTSQRPSSHFYLLSAPECGTFYVLCLRVTGAAVRRHGTEITQTQEQAQACQAPTAAPSVPSHSTSVCLGATLSAKDKGSGEAFKKSKVSHAPSSVPGCMFL